MRFGLRFEDDFRHRSVARREASYKAQRLRVVEAFARAGGGPGRVAGALSGYGSITDVPMLISTRGRSPTLTVRHARFPHRRPPAVEGSGPPGSARTDHAAPSYRIFQVPPSLIQYWRFLILLDRLLLL